MFTLINCEIVASATRSDMQQCTYLHATILSIHSVYIYVKAEKAQWGLPISEI